MAYSLKSPEFAQAFRIVAESLLSALQSIDLTTLSAVVNNEAVVSDETVGGAQVKKMSYSQPNREGEVRYAACPIKNGEGGYIFKNLKAERQEESTYKIYRYDDGTCEFELCDLKGDSRQIFKDNMGDRMPATVGLSEGEITTDGQISIIQRGKGKVDGRSVIITAPLHVKFS